MNDRETIDLQDESYLLKDVRFLESHNPDLCGPVTLAMAMSIWGRNPNLSDIKSQSYTNRKNGAHYIDMLTSARRKGFVTTSVKSLKDIFEELHAGNSVITMHNLGISFFPVWHFSLVVGYDAKSHQVISHDRNRSFYKIPIATFLKTWDRSDRKAFVITPAGKLAATANILEVMTNGLNFERSAQVEDAHLVYKSVVNRWPKHYAGYIARSNLALSQNKSQKASHFLRQGLEQLPNDPRLLHNLNELKKLE